MREQKKAELRQELLTTAMEMFRDRGYDATRIVDIVERVRVSEATFFNYFPTKEAILQESSAEAKDLYRILLEHLLSRTEEPVVDRVRELVQVVGDSFAADDVFMETVVTETNLFYGSTGDAASKDLANFALLAALFRQGQERGEVSSKLDPLQLAEMLTAVYMLTITNWLIRQWGERDELGSRLSQAMDVFFEGCRSREE